MAIFKIFDFLYKNTLVNDAKVRFKLNFYVFIGMVLLMNVSYVQTANAFNVVCENITLHECLNVIQRAYSIKIETTINFEGKLINTVLAQETPLKAVQALLMLADISNYIITQDGKFNIYIDFNDPREISGSSSISSVDKIDTNKESPHEVTNKENALPPQSDSSKHTPTPEQLKTLKAKAKVVEQNLDRKVVIPGLDSSNSITVRQLIQLQEQAAERVPTNYQTLPIPGIPEDKSISNKTQAYEEDSSEIANKESVLPPQSDLSMYIPTSEQLETLKDKAKVVEQNLDRKIVMPGLDSSNSITFRQLIEFQEQAAVRVPANDQILPMPGVPVDKSITYGQAMGMQKNFLK